ncbi:MAG TPA: nucleotide exchange factor GrpE [Chroococcidiopsis sp.]
MENEATSVEVGSTEAEVSATEESDVEPVAAETELVVEEAESIEADDDAAEADGGANYRKMVGELVKQLESVKLQLDERSTQYMRIAADFDNFRKRTQKEKEDLEQQVKCNTVIELLPVVDNFERARSQIKPQTDSEMNIHKSYQGVYKDLVERLKRIGVAPMRSEGKEFDPNLHEAVMREATAEFPEGTVMTELVRDYMLGERVLRHAMVKVAAPSESGGDSDETPQEASEG